MYVQDQYLKVKTIIPETSLSNTPVNLAVNGARLTFVNVSGVIYINPITTANPLTAFPVRDGEVINLIVPTNLSIVSDVVGAVYKAIIWES